MSWKELIDSDISAEEFIRNYHSGRMYTIKEAEKLDPIFRAFADSLKYTCINYRENR